MLYEILHRFNRGAYVGSHAIYYTNPDRNEVGEAIACGSADFGIAAPVTEQMLAAWSDHDALNARIQQLEAVVLALQSQLTEKTEQIRDAVRPAPLSRVLKVQS